MVNALPLYFDRTAWHDHGRLMSVLEDMLMRNNNFQHVGVIICIAKR